MSPCQPDLMSHMGNDTDTLLTQSGKLTELFIQKYEKEIKDYEKGLPLAKDKEVIEELYFLNGQVTYWKRLLEDPAGMFGKSSEHWSCVSGSCSSNICASGSNRLVQEIPMYNEKENNSSDADAKSGGSEPVKHMTPISYFVIMFSTYMFNLHKCMY